MKMNRNVIMNSMQSYGMQCTCTHTHAEAHRGGLESSQFSLSCHFAARYSLLELNGRMSMRNLVRIVKNGKDFAQLRRNCRWKEKYSILGSILIGFCLTTSNGKWQSANCSTRNGRRVQLAFVLVLDTKRICLLIATTVVNWFENKLVLATAFDSLFDASVWDSIQCDSR